MEVVRTIHPVGQGAFYTEQIRIDDKKVYNVVYDCGSNTKRNNKLVIDEEITSFFKKDVEIDLLFISHFDQDHVNGIKSLLKRVKVINVVIPLIDKEDLWFYSSVITGFEGFLNSLVKKSENLFAVKTDQNDANNDDANQNEPIYLEDRRRNRDETRNGGYFNDNNIDKINSNTILRFSNSIDWYYIVYNYDKKERQKKLKKALRQNSQYNLAFKTLLKKITSAEKQSEKEPLTRDDLSKIKKIYTHTFGKDGSNKTSLIVYSGREGSNSYVNYFSRCGHASCGRCVSCYRYGIYRFCHSIYFQSEGCLYFGDNDLNQHYLNKYDSKQHYLLDDLRSEMQGSLNHLGLIQVPHHGSKNNFNNRIFEYCSIFHDLNVTNFFVSYGSRNGYGHPSIGVCEEIFSHNAQLYYVTENKESVLMQHIIANKQV